MGKPKIAPENARGGALQNRGAPESAREGAFPVISFMDTSVGTLTSTPILGSTSASTLRSYFGVFPFPASLPGQEVP